MATVIKNHVVPYKKEVHVNGNDSVEDRYYQGTKAEYVSAVDPEGNPTTVAQELSDLHDEIEQGGGGSVDIDASAFKTKVTKSETNGNILVDEKELEVFDDQDLQAKTAADLPFTYKEDGSSVKIKYYTDEEDVLAKYPSPIPAQYGTFSPQPKSVSDENPIRVCLEPYYDNGFDTFWGPGEGKNKVRFTGLVGLQIEGEDGYWMVWGEEFYGRVSPVQDYPGNPIAFEATLVSGATLDAGTAYILNGIAPDATGLTFEVTVGSAAAKTGTTVVFEGGENVTIKLIADNGFSFGSTNAVYPMVRLATESDDSFAPYENVASLRGFGSQFILTQEITSLDGSTVQNPKKSFFIDAKTAEAPNRYLGGISGDAERQAPDNNYYHAYYTQQLTDGENIYTIELWTDDYVLDNGSSLVRFYYEETGDGGSQLVLRTEDFLLNTYYRYKLNDGEWVVGETIPFLNNKLFLARTQYAKDSENVLWYNLTNNISFFTKEAERAFIDLNCIFSGILDFGLSARYDWVEKVIYNYHQEQSIYPNFKYISDRDVCDMNNWQQPSEGAFVIVLSNTMNPTASLFRTWPVGKIGFQANTESTFKIVTYYSDTRIDEFENLNGQFVFCCNPGIATSRDTYDTYLTGDLAEFNGYANQHGEFVDKLKTGYDSEVVEGKMTTFPKKKVAPMELEFEFDGQGGYKSNKRVAWNSNITSVANLLEMYNWSKTEGSSHINVSYNTNNDSIATFEVYGDNSGSLSETVVIMFTTGLQYTPGLHNGDPICVALRPYINDIDNFNYNKTIDKNNCYLFLSKSGSYHDTQNIFIPVNNIDQSKAFAYDSSYQYFGFAFTLRGMGITSSYERLRFTPMIRKADTYVWYDEEWVEHTEIVPFMDLTAEPYGYIPEHQVEIAVVAGASLNTDSGDSGGGSGNYGNYGNYSYGGGADRVKITTVQRGILDPDESSYGVPKYYLGNFSGLNFYDIICSYNNKHYKFFYHLTRVAAEDINLLNDDGYTFDLIQRSGTVEIWSNHPIANIQGDNYYWDDDNSEFVEFYSSYQISNLSDDDFYFNYVGYMEDDTVTHIAGILGSEGSGKWYNGRTNIPMFDDTSAAEAYKTKLLADALANSVYGVKFDLKNGKIYKTYDFVPSFYNVYESTLTSDGGWNGKVIWEDWKSQYGDSRYDAAPPVGVSYSTLLRADKYYRNGEYVDSPFCWDLQFKECGSEGSESSVIDVEFDANAFFLPISEKDYSNYTDIWAMLGTEQEFEDEKLGALHMSYSASGFAYVEDVKYLLEHGGSGSGPDLSNYLTKTEAAATYLTTSDAATTYATKTELANAIATAITNVINGTY